MSSVAVKQVSTKKQTKGRKLKTNEENAVMLQFKSMVYPPLESSPSSTSGRII